MNNYTLSRTREWDTEVSNVCDCETTDYCDGDCWETVKYFVETSLGDLWQEDVEWVVDGLPLWNRDVRGVFRARSIDDFIRGITVNDVWTLRLLRDKDIIHASLSHHDVPTGRSVTVQRVELDDTTDDQ
jgi:hypothetical protein